MRHGQQNAGMRLLAALLLACLPVAAASAQDSFKVYRCVADDGRVALRDTPCPDGQAQEVRTMQAPQDPPPRPEPAPAPAPQPEPAPTPVVERVVVLRTPQPVYQCTTPDGDTYTSDSDAGNPRWVPLWTLGYPLPVRRGERAPLAISGGSVRIDDTGTTLRRPGVGPRWVAGAGTWIRDTCHPLPQAEACARLREERSEIRRAIFNGMPSERDALRPRERSINARLDADCGGR